MIENKYDWKIHKILDEAKRVYICHGRGCGKTRWLEEELGRTITEYSPKSDPVKLDKTTIQKIKEAVIDWDLYSNYGLPELHKRFDEYWESEVLNYIRKDIESWRPKVYLDTSLLHDDWYNQRLWVMDSVLGSFIVTSEGDE